MPMAWLQRIFRREGIFQDLCLTMQRICQCQQETAKDLLITKPPPRIRETRTQTAVKWQTLSSWITNQQ